MDWGSLAVRVALGGVLVVAFSALGEVIVPKHLSGVFGGAPSVALASLGLTLIRRGPAPIPALMAGMVIGALAFLAYVLTVRVFCRRGSMIAGAYAAWIVWLGVAAAGLSMLPR